jgi:hypothetical protein
MYEDMLVDRRYDFKRGTNNQKIADRGEGGAECEDIGQV